ncbi:hypothetical protein Aperf_G00000038255 [Anoplocephala perfoliata]
MSAPCLTARHWAVWLTNITRKIILSVLLAYLATAHSSCQFPEFLLLPSTNIWWSGSVSHLTSSSSLSSFAKLAVRGDLRKMILSYPLDSSLRSNQYPLNRYPFQSQSLGINNSMAPAIHIDLRCDRVVDKFSGTYLAEIQLINARTLYICMRFHILDRSSTPEVFELILGESMTANSECSTSSSNLHRSIWIPNPSKYISTNHRSRCPLVGGFQARNFVEFSTQKPICSSSVYVTIDSECIRGEGIEFHFNEPSCNPFEPTLMTRFACFVQWNEAGNLIAILVKEKNPEEYLVATVFYYEPPMQVDRGNNEYGSFTKVYIGLGIFRPMGESTKDSARGPFPAFLYDLEPPDNAVKMSPPILYEVLIRGACKRSLFLPLESVTTKWSSVKEDAMQTQEIDSSAGDRVRMTHSDSCEINASYRGLWLLIDPLPSPGELGEHRHHLRKLVNIADRTVTFADILGDETFYEFSCLREASEIVPDWYILGGRQLQPGWWENLLPNAVLSYH